MAVYAIGDVQGCLEPLQRLLDELNFDPAADTLWFAGDLVNRGPESVAVLRLVYGLGEHALTVLGNHDLSLLAIAAGVGRRGRHDTVDDVLSAPDAKELLDWLHHRPLLHHDAGLGFTLVHAGLAPAWDLATAQACARELEAALRGSEYHDFLADMFGNQPERWTDDLAGIDRLRCITNHFTRMRYCRFDGSLDLRAKNPPGQQPQGLVPWFELPWRRNRDLDIVFGHWAALGHYRAPGIHALDSGCVWGGRLTALRLDDGGETVVSVACKS
jgi:bis(5'-nucleosyl)-tetraphosphatase (symmetrical)